MTDPQDEQNGSQTPAPPPAADSPTEAADRLPAKKAAKAVKKVPAKKVAKKSSAKAAAKTPAKKAAKKAPPVKKAPPALQAAATPPALEQARPQAALTAGPGRASSPEPFLAERKEGSMRIPVSIGLAALGLVALALRRFRRG